MVAAVLRVVFSLLAAGVLLSAIPKRPDAIVRFGLLPSALRTTTVAWVLVGLFALSTVLFTPVQWLRHPTQEARLFLRSVLTRWCYADLARIARRHVNRRRKRNLRRLKTDRKNQSQLSGGASVQTEEG